MDLLVAEDFNSLAARDEQAGFQPQMGTSTTTSAAIQKAGRQGTSTEPPLMPTKPPPGSPWPMELGWRASGDNLSATFMPRLCVYGRLLAPPGRGAATGIDRALEVA